MTEQLMKKILIVEDDPAILDVYQIIMKKAGFDVQTTSLGREAIEMMKKLGDSHQVMPDIILLDLILPDLNGMDVLKEIRANDASKNIKVFIFSNQEENQTSQMDGIKPDKFIVKANITPSQLVELIKKELV